jgi:hypothetical protein
LLFALAQPVAFAGLLIAFLLALTLRAYAIRITARSLGLTDRRESITPRPREDIDPFGAVAAFVGGAGWGKAIDVDEVPRFRGRGRAAAVFLAGPVVTLIASQLLFLAYELSFPNEVPVAFYSVGQVLTGNAYGSAGAVLLISIAAGLLGFGLLALIPIPPLDGFGIMWNAVRRPGNGLQWMRLWFDHKNIGVVILVVLAFFPLGNSFLLLPLDLIGTLFMLPWG